MAAPCMSASARSRLPPSAPAAARLAVDVLTPALVRGADQGADLVRVGCGLDALEVVLVDPSLLERVLAQPAQHLLPLRPREQDRREVAERQRLEELIEGAEATRCDHKCGGIAHEHDLPREEVAEAK